MLYAYNRSLEEGIDVALIDQDIRNTVRDLKRVRRKEKIKALASLALSPIVSHKIDISSIPEEEMVEEMVKEVKFKYPEIYQVLIDSRDKYMAKRLIELCKKRPKQDIIAFVGAGHRKGIETYLQELSE